MHSNPNAEKPLRMSKSNARLKSGYMSKASGLGLAGGGRGAGRGGGVIQGSVGISTTLTNSLIGSGTSKQWKISMGMTFLFTKRNSKKYPWWWLL